MHGRWNVDQAKFNALVEAADFPRAVAFLDGGGFRLLGPDDIPEPHRAKFVGWAARKKTQRPQRLEIPPMLRPILRDWWER